MRLLIAEFDTAACFTAAVQVRNLSRKIQSEIGATAGEVDAALVVVLRVQHFFWKALAVVAHFDQQAAIVESPRAEDDFSLRVARCIYQNITDNAG